MKTHATLFGCLIISLLLSLNSCKEKGEGHFQESVAALAKGDKYLAYSEIQKALKLDSKRCKYLFQKSRVHLQFGQIDSILFFYYPLSQDTIYRDSIDLLICDYYRWRGKEELLKEESDIWTANLVRQYSSKIVDRNSKVKQAYVDLMWAYNRINRSREALIVGIQAERIYGNDVDILVEKANAFIVEERLTEANDLINQILENMNNEMSRNDKLRGRCFYLLSTCQFFQGNNQEALNLISKAIEFDSTEVLYFQNRGALYIFSGDTLKACEDYSKASDFGWKRGFEYLLDYCQ